MEYDLKTVHFINLTNGIEAIKEYNLTGYSFIRLQSTWCEQRLWNNFFFDLDNNLLINLALGNECIIYDYNSRHLNKPPRAIWQGLNFVITVLYFIWFNKEYEDTDPALLNYFKIEYNKLSPTVIKRLKYFRRYLMTDKLNIKTICKYTKNDGNYKYYSEILKGIRD